MDYSIKTASFQDKEIVTSFLAEISGDFPIPLDRKVEIPSYVEKLLSLGIVYIAIEDGGKVCGAAAGYANDEERMTAFLSVIAVSRHARGGGTARALLHAFERGALERGMCSVVLETHCTNARAINFYRRCGFTIDYEHRGLSDDVLCFKCICGLSIDRPNILLTSVGRRAYLVKWFREALAGAGEVHVVNSDPATPAFASADRAETCPLIYSDGYIPFLLDYVRENRIGAVLSLFDIDIPVLAAHRADFIRLGCFPVVASPRTAAICNDKLRSARFLESAGIPAVGTYPGADAFAEAVSAGRATFPALVKPRWGMGSIGVLKVEDESELRVACSMVARKVEGTYLRYESAADPEGVVIVQEVVRGAEYGMDVVCGLSGTYRTSSARRKVAMRAGETDVAETVSDDARFDTLARSLASALSFPGNMDVDVFDTDDGLVVLEMNARFGGGYPFSHMAGVDLPRALVSWLRGDSEPEGCLEVDSPGLFMKEIELVRLEA